jgi:hypothetical protein
MKNKLICLAIITICSFTSVYAQMDTTFVTARTEQGAMEKQTFIEQYDYVFLNKEPQKYMLKWNAAAAIPVLSSDWKRTPYGNEGYSDFSIEGALEIKITPAISLNTTMVMLPNGEFSIFKILAFGVEPRYYINKKRQIKQGKSASNLSGMYLGANFLQENKFRSFSILQRNDYYSAAYKNYVATLRLGFQQRIFKKGYLDFSWGLGQATHTSFEILPDQRLLTSKKWIGHIDQKITLGMAFGGKNSKQQENRSCDFFKCYREDKSKLKIDLLGLVRNLNTQEQFGKLSVAYEHKLKESAFSLQYEANLYGSHTKRDDYKPEIYYGGGFAIEGRWFYSLKKRIAAGKSGNNLNGAFIGLHIDNLYSKLQSAESLDSRFFNRVFRYLPIWGIQYKIFGRGYFEYRAGLGVAFREKRTRDYDGYQNTAHDVEPSIFSELKIGLAF